MNVKVTEIIFLTHLVLCYAFVLMEKNEQTN
jgi:hypothetical protein